MRRPHSYDAIACGRACSHESVPSGGHGASRRAPPVFFSSSLFATLRVIEGGYVAIF